MEINIGLEFENNHCFSTPSFSNHNTSKRVPFNESSSFFPFAEMKHNNPILDWTGLEAREREKKVGWQQIEWTT